MLSITSYLIPQSASLMTCKEKLL